MTNSLFLVTSMFDQRLRVIGDFSSSSVDCPETIVYFKSFPQNAIRSILQVVQGMLPRAAADKIEVSLFFESIVDCYGRECMIRVSQLRNKHDLMIELVTSVIVLDIINWFTNYQNCQNRHQLWFSSSLALQQLPIPPGFPVPSPLRHHSDTSQPKRSHPLPLHLLSVCPSR